MPPLSEAVLGELARFAILAIQAAKFKGNDDEVVAHIDQMDKAGATFAQISDSLRDMNLAEETKAQEKIDAKRRELGQA